MCLFLPGNTKDHKQWCESLMNAFEGDNTMLYYDHWKGEGNIQWDVELEKIKDLNLTEPINVVGKSAGCILGMKAQRLGYINVNKFVFIGFPYNWALNRGDNVDELLDNLITPTLFIQKPYDPVIGYEQLKEIIDKKGLNVSIIKYQRPMEVDNNHSYEDIPYLKKVIESFVG